MKVVIVDDSPLIVSRLRQQISALALVEICGVAANIPTALQVIELQRPDVVILDIYLKEDAPSSSGITLLAMLRQSYPQLQIIMLTNLSGEAYSNRCKELGANYFLDKSSDFEKVPELLLHIHQLLNSAAQ
jgi:DNA-binding NarL/FixJ family response regulator